MKVLVGCEYSGVIRDAFAERGHDAWSCDLLPSESPGKHHQGDLLEFLSYTEWDLFICHPPCTYIAVVANKWFTVEWLRKEPWRIEARREAIEFAKKLWAAPIKRICLENPKGVLGRHIGKPSQVIQPHFFGDSFQKETHLWLKGLPPLHHFQKGTLFETHVEPGEFKEWVDKKTGRRRRQPKWFYDARHSKEGHGKTRSKSFTGIARAMAEQWG